MKGPRLFYKMASTNDEIYVGENLSCVKYGPCCEDQSLIAIGGYNVLYIGLITLEVHYYNYYYYYCCINCLIVRGY